MDARQVIDLLSRAHTWVWAQEGSLLSYRGFRLFLDRLIGGRDGGGLSIALCPGLRSGGLKSKFGRGPRHLGQESDGLVLLVPRVQAGRVFWGTQLGTLIIAG